MQTIADRLESAHKLIAQATHDAHRPANSVKLLAVSKTKPVSDLRQAYDAGQRLFGENYVQEGIEKIQQMRSFTDIEWHFIGPLQSNKTKAVAEHFDWVQSIDRLKIARRLSEQRPHDMAPLNVCIQINIDDEETKSGVLASDVKDFAQEIADYGQLRLRGVMAIPSASSSGAQQIASFRAMQNIFDDLKATYSSIDTLSIGMSNDASLAIQHGSTMVRLGTAIFGSRQ
ncbi:YggS family pyridoxal phosphate-dependent enzyme [Alteromonas facilis]|uniref:YggS family pyridoxal phosphate-dependent enzyme n=1 Tax=Alteromonas facilis TaxID=2048004 RepID=UPI000C28E8DC|nr:YggS family pyridoxal phosphate-dependent enzyme [Alteromonas facilis]